MASISSATRRLAQEPPNGSMIPQDRVNGGIFTPRSWNKRTRVRFATDRRRSLVRHLGREPSYAEYLLIGRIIACEWDLRRIDDQLDRGEELSEHMARHRYAIENRLRLDLRELGLRPNANEPAGPVETLTNHLRKRRGSAA